MLLRPRLFVFTNSKWSKEPWGQHIYKQKLQNSAYKVYDNIHIGGESTKDVSKYIRTGWQKLDINLQVESGDILQQT